MNVLVEELDVVHNGFQPVQRAEKSNKTQKCFNIHYENIHFRPLYCQRPLWVWSIRGATAPPLSCHQGAVKKQLMVCLSNLLSTFFLSCLLNGPLNPAEMSPDIFPLSTGDYFNMSTRALLLLQTFLANLRAERFDTGNSWEGAPPKGETAASILDSYILKK